MREEFNRQSGADQNYVAIAAANPADKNEVPLDQRPYFDVGEPSVFWQSRAVSMKHILQTGEVPINPDFSLANMFYGNMTIDLQADDPLMNAMRQVEQAVFLKINDLASRNSGLKEIMDKDSWTVEDRSTWELYVSKIVAEEIDKVPGLQDYRTEWLNPKTGAFQFTFGVDHRTHLNDLSEDITGVPAKKEEIIKNIESALEKFKNITPSPVDRKMFESFKEEVASSQNALTNNFDKNVHLIEHFVKSLEMNRRPEFEETLDTLKDALEDLKNNKGHIEFDCDKMAVIKGILMQQADRHFLKPAPENGDPGNLKRQTNYYIVTGNSSGTPHAFVISPDTMNSVETTSDYSETYDGGYQKNVDPNYTLKDLADGKPMSFHSKGLGENYSTFGNSKFSKSDSDLKILHDATADVQKFSQLFKQLNELPAYQMLKETLKAAEVTGEMDQETKNMIKDLSDTPELKQLTQKIQEEGDRMASAWQKAIEQSADNPAMAQAVKEALQKAMRELENNNPAAGEPGNTESDLQKTLSENLFKPSLEKLDKIINQQSMEQNDGGVEFSKSQAGVHAYT